MSRLMYQRMSQRVVRTSLVKQWDPTGLIVSRWWSVPEFPRKPRAPSPSGSVHDHDEQMDFSKPDDLNLRCYLTNPLMPNGISHLYQLDEFISNKRAVW